MFALELSSSDLLPHVPLRRFGFVTARFHDDVVSLMADAARSVLLSVGYAIHQIPVVSVPGSLELPLATRCLIRTCDAVMAFGCVIQGGTIHYDLVSYQSTKEILAMSAEGYRVMPTILMTDQKEKALANASSVGRTAMLSFIDLLVKLDQGEKHVW